MRPALQKKNSVILLMKANFIYYVNVNGKAGSQYNARPPIALHWSFIDYVRHREEMYSLDHACTG